MGSLFAPITMRLKILGVGRLFGKIENVHGQDLKSIPDTLFTEDLHYHKPSGQLFGASEGDEKTRNTWFPPLENWNDPHTIGRGTIVVINTKTLTATRLTLRNFNRPFNTHGIDIYTPHDDPTSVYIIAVNHLPNPEYYATNSPPKDPKIPKARSRLEFFHHRIGSTEATHIRSIWHPLIRTPNDVLFKSLDEIYVTNDHYYREGHKRLLEDISWGSFGKQTDLIHLTITDILSASDSNDDSAGVVGVVANQGIHNNNGLGYGRSRSEIMIARTCIGQLQLAVIDEKHPPSLKITDTIQVPCTVDNPSYFADPYAQRTGRDASGYVLAGLAQAAAFPNGLDPVSVWLVQPNTASDGKGGKWLHKLVFQDDGHILRTAATAVLVAIDPDNNRNKKQAHLFVTGPLGKAVVVSTIDL